MRNTYLFLLAFALGLGVLQAQQQRFSDDVISDFENLNLETNSYWNGSDLSGGFISGLAFFPNDYDPDWMAWNQWAYSNMADDTTAGFMNQYSAITAVGYDPGNSGGSTYAVAYVVSDFVTAELIPVPLRFTDSTSHAVKGFYVTNGTYPFLSMMYGDEYTKKFGGESGDDPDYFKLMVWGMFDGVETDTVEFFLADYQFSNNAEDYIINSWEWVDLENLGEVDSLLFSMESTDVGMYGMNTPAFFCMDNLTIVPDNTGIGGQDANLISIRAFPNPSVGSFRLETGGAEISELCISDLSGNLVYSNETYRNMEEVHVRGLASGCYIVRVRSEGRFGSYKLMIQ